MSFDPRAYARQMAAQYGLDPNVFLRMLQAESRFDPNAKSVVRGKDYVSYGQLGAAAAQDVGITDRFDPKQNIEGSARYLKMQLDEFGSYPLALAAYNAGPQTVRDKGGIPNYPETRQYLTKILGPSPKQTVASNFTNGLQGNYEMQSTQQQRNNTPPARQGIGQSLINFLTRQNPSTGLNPMQNFAAALDPLILPEARMGDVIRAQGQQRVQQGVKNRTIAELERLARSGDSIAASVLASVQTGALTPSEGMQVYLGKKFETPKDARTAFMKDYAFYKSQNPNATIDDFLEAKKAAGVTIQGPEKEFSKAMGSYYADKNIQLNKDANNAQDMLQTISIQENLINDPNFQSGAGQAFLDTAKSLFSRFGFGDADLASNETFQAFANRSVLEMLGGSLGTGVSNADVTFIKSSVATLENTPDGIAKLLSLQKKIAQRKIQVAELARQWKLENNTEFLDDKWETYISKWRRENPVFPDAEDYL